MSAPSSRRTVHPFPARMAPELAIRELHRQHCSLRVLDPMAGSGTVLREAIRNGHQAVGLDCDPLAVLMARVWTTPIDDDLIERAAADVMNIASGLGTVHLPWIDDDAETTHLIRYWFARRQRTALRRLAYALAVATYRRRRPYRNAVDVLKLALSRIIVTKDAGASLGRDVSHSRPHRVQDSSDYDVLVGFQKSVAYIRRVLQDDPPAFGASVEFGDARHLPLEDDSIDLVLTSPPYLNAIDYIRGHKLALVWLGYNVTELRNIRAEAIGAERAPNADLEDAVDEIRRAIIDDDTITARHGKMVSRYAADVDALMSEVYRVLRPGGRAVLVVGNSCLRGKFIRNSEGVKAAGRRAGLELDREDTRHLPERRRYLPLAKTEDPSLGKRMRTETVLTFRAT
jgi:SAM-dependent methyltransferase